MYNYFMLIGIIKRVEKKPSLTLVTMEVARPFKDANGSMVSDSFVVLFHDYLAEYISDELIGKGLGVKGHMCPNGESISLVAEKIIYFGRGE